METKNKKMTWGHRLDAWIRRVQDVNVQTPLSRAEFHLALELGRHCLVESKSSRRIRMSYICHRTGLNRNTLYKARIGLTDKGLIKYSSSKGGKTISHLEQAWTLYTIIEELPIDVPKDVPKDVSELPEVPVMVDDSEDDVDV